MLTTDSNAETKVTEDTTVHENNTTQRATRPKSRRIRKLPAREIIDAEFINPNSSKTFNELLLSQNVSTQNRSILSELWGASNRKTVLPPITIGSPQKRPLQSVNSVVTNKPADSQQIKKTTARDTFELNVVIPPSLMKHTPEKENKSKDSDSEDDEDTTSMDGDVDVNLDSLDKAINEGEATVEEDSAEHESTTKNRSHDNETIPEKDESNNEITMEQDKDLQNSTAEDDTTDDAIVNTKDNPGIQDNTTTENNDIDSTNTSDDKDENAHESRSTDGNETTKIDLVADEATNNTLNEGNESNDIAEDDDSLEEEAMSNETTVDNESLTDNTSLNEATNETDNETQESLTDTQNPLESDTATIENNDEPATAQNDIDQQIIIPENTKLYNESKSPVIVIERVSSIEDDIDKIWPTMDDNDSSTDESWLKISDVEEEEEEDAVHKLISDATIKTNKRKRPHTDWIVNGRPRPDPTVGRSRKQRLADKLEQPYIIRKKIKSSWICK